MIHDVTRTKPDGSKTWPPATDTVLGAMFHSMGKKETSLRETGGEGASALLKTTF
jgi:hypothetical protein